MYADAFLRAMLAKPATVACIGVSLNPVRPSHYVARYLSAKGYRVVPVNPGAAGRTLLGETVRGGLAEVEGPVDILDVFRRPEAVPAVVEDGLRRFDLRCVWLQIGIVSTEAEALCREAGVAFVQDRCPKIEYQRLFGELRMGGFATGIVSSKRPP